MDPYSNDNRTFLHEISTPMSILKLVLTKLSQNFSDESINVETKKMKIAELMKRAESALEKMENLHADFKEQLVKREKTNSQTVNKAS